jgi:hypothetical protein
MRPWARQIVVLFLALFVGAGMGLSTVQASTMTVTMAAGTPKASGPMADMGMKMAPELMAQGLGLAGKGGCATCPTGDDSGKLAHCPPGCIVPAFAVLSADLEQVPTTLSSRLSAPPLPFLHGRSSLPDPYPPRSSDLV